MAESKPSKMQYKILPAGVDDCSAFGLIEVVAFNDLVKEDSETSLYRFLFGPATEESRAWRAEEFIDKVKNQPTTRFWKVVISDLDDPSQDKIIAGALWHFHTEPFAPEDWKDIECPAFVNAAACNQFLGDLMSVKKKHMQGKRFGFLSVLGTLPEYRGQGIASALMSHGIAEGIKAGLNEFWVDGSLDGHALYEKYGFRDVELTYLDFAKYGGVGKSSIAGMRKTIE